MQSSATLQNILSIIYLHQNNQYYLTCLLFAYTLQFLKNTFTTLPMLYQWGLIGAKSHIASKYNLYNLYQLIISIDLASAFPDGNYIEVMFYNETLVYRD